MSFYGNILNRLEAFFSTIKVKGGGDIEAGEYGANALNVEGTNGIILEANDETKTLTIDGQNFITKIEEDASNTTDGYKIYKFYHGDNKNPTGTINIPLDLILKSSKVETYSTEFKIGDTQYAAGTYLVLTFRTDEGTGQTDCYINVTELNELSGGQTATIEILIDKAQKITAELLDNSIETSHLKDLVVTTDKINSEAVTTAKIANGAVTSAKINDNVVSYEASTKTLSLFN